MYDVISYQAAKSINITECKRHLNLNLLFSDSDELYFKLTKYKYVYVFEFGMIGFFNFNNNEISSFLEEIMPFCKGYFKAKLIEKIKVEISQNEIDVNFDIIKLPSIDEQMIRLVLLYTSQSVALNRYGEISERLLKETNSHTKYLEKNGKLNITGKSLKKFIGRVLNVKNKILENLYIFDAPDITWENEQLNLLDNKLKQNFDLKDRYRRINERNQIIKENLDLFKGILEHSESSKLEWIIIILILVEVIDMLILKFM
jgi:uncharacterized Rmd1/YagE family protein